MQVNDALLEALAHLHSLRSLQIGYSCKCTLGGVLGLARLPRLERLQVMGHSIVDFGHMTAEDLQQLRNMTSLSIGVVPAEAFQVSIGASLLVNGNAATLVDR